MQIVPSTGRRLAPAVGIRRFKTAMLTKADINLRLGTLYFSRLVEQFGGTYYALASYNAGESRVVRWKAERPGLDEDEFIDDIPFPETQNYVKRILGTAEDYRRLYGEGGGAGPSRHEGVDERCVRVEEGCAREEEDAAGEGHDQEETPPIGGALRTSRPLRSRGRGAFMVPLSCFTL